MVSGAALKGDHLDIEERRKERRGEDIYTYIHTLLFEIERQTELASTFTLREPIPGSTISSFLLDTENTRAVPVETFLSRTSFYHFERNVKVGDLESIRRM